MTYQVTYSEPNNPAKAPIIVADQTLNTQTSITFVGKNYAGYGAVLATDMLHMLENFANATAPANPVQGQLWYDTAGGINTLKVYDGTTWGAAGSLKKSASAPDVANSTVGDLWSDTANNQLYLFSGSNWILVGPQFSAGTLTGPIVDEIVDTNNITYPVISLYANNYRIAIISKDTFIPKAYIAGFSSINQGINLSTTDSTNTASLSRIWGTASSADALLVNNTAIPASSFLRNDQVSLTNNAINIKSDAGISLGQSLNFNIGVNGNSTVFYSKSSSNSIDFNLNSSILVHLSPLGKVGIGPNNVTPASALDVLGTITTSAGLTDTGTLDLTDTNGPSIQTLGGLQVAKKTSLGDDTTINGQLYLNWIDSSSNPITGAALLPSTTAIYDIGSANATFRNIYAQSFVGNFNGVFTGQLTGSITGAAAKLQSPTNFRLTGDVSAPDVSFDGQTTSGVALFNTTISSGIITSKAAADDSAPTDQLLVYRAGTGLLSMTKQTLFNHVATMPVGALMPFAGTTVPPGYLLCDGSEVKVSDYTALFQVIGYVYKPTQLLQGLGTFALPDMRGRFPLGRDNMDNGVTVPSKDGSGTQIQTGGGSANRVTDITADTIGTGSGSQTQTLTINNLPDHFHNLSSGNAQYYAAGLPGAGPDPNAVPGLGLPTTSSGSGFPSSGSVTANTLGQGFLTMNPYATINYIIYTGAL